jgi:hypothetical protein
MRPLFAIVLYLASASAALSEDARDHSGGAQPDVPLSTSFVTDLASAVKVTLAPFSGAWPGEATPDRDDAHQRAVTAGVGVVERCDPRIDTVALRSLVQAEAENAQVDSKLALTILELESNDGTFLNSNKDARGPMQLLPSTAARYGVHDICDPMENVRGAMLFLKDLTAQFQGNMMLIAAAYNAGPDRVYDARGVPAIAETVRYVANAANKYYGLNVFASRRKHARGLRLPPPNNAPALVSVAPSPVARPQQEWIGGSVLYVGASENGEAQ